MKILLIDHDSGTTGSTISMVYLINFLIAKNHQVFVLTLKNETVISNLDLTEKNRKNLSFHRYSSVFLNTWSLDFHFTDQKKYTRTGSIISNFRNLLKISYTIFYSLKLIREIEPDIVYANEYVSSAFLIVPHLFGIETICHVRSRMLPQGTDKFAEFLSKWILRNFARKIFCITSIEMNQFLKSSEISKKCKVVPEFLDERDFKNERKINIENETRILFAGGISELKGTLEFIKTINVLLHKGYAIKAVISGKEYHSTLVENEYTDHCKQESKLIGNGRNFEFYENIKKNGLFENIDILVVTNSESHFSRPIIEAWANKVAVVAYENEHNSNVITDGLNGLLAEKNHEALASKIGSILSNKILFETIVNNGFLSASTKFDSNVILNDLFNAV